MEIAWRGQSRTASFSLARIDSALEVARTIAQRIAENGPVAVRNIKRAVLEVEGMTEDEAREVEMRLGMEVFSTEDAKEGPRAFKEKRKPNFKGS